MVQSEIKLNKDHNLFHINKENVKESEIVATIHIPLEYLKRWYNRKDRAASSDRENPPYVQLLNSEIIGKSLIKIDEICERKEGKLLGNITKQLVVCVSF